MQGTTLNRIRNELINLNKNRVDYYQMVQAPDNEYHFYFLVRGDSDSPYDGGRYIGRIEVPKDYPQSPVNYFMLTPSGRYKINSKICLTNSGYHKESWSAAWNFETMLTVFCGIFHSDSETGISHIRDTPANRKKMAADSHEYNLSNHRTIYHLFDQFVSPDGEKYTEEQTRDIVELHKANLLAEKEREKEEKKQRREEKKAKRAARKAKKEERRAKRKAKKAEKKSKRKKSKAAEESEEESNDSELEREMDDDLDEEEEVAEVEAVADETNEEVIEETEADADTDAEEEAEPEVEETKKPKKTKKSGKKKTGKKKVAKKSSKEKTAKKPKKKRAKKSA